MTSPVVLIPDKVNTNAQVLVNRDQDQPESDTEAVEVEEADISPEVQAEASETHRLVNKIFGNKIKPCHLYEQS